MKFLAVFALFAVVACGSLPFNPELNTHWENFKRVYGKKYTGSEEGARRLVWEGHVSSNMHHNLAADMGFHTYKRGINKYSDLSHKEFVSRMNGFKMGSSRGINGSSWLPPSNIRIPESVDWRKDGLVTPVKDQGDCGSCWAFSTTGSLEGQNKKKTGQLVSLSEQNLIDCSKPEGNLGCEGGMMDDGFRYIEKNHGIDSEESYPYIAQDGMCHFKKSAVGATCSGFVDISAGDEDALKKAVATVGPISVAIDASVESFKEYKSGVYDETSCSSTALDHGVLIVGYGTENGKDYWLVKNSWGDSWGLGGYIKMARNKNNQCGIATMASYPLV